MIKAAMAGQKQAKIGRGARGVAETLFEGATRGRSGACVCVWGGIPYPQRLEHILNHLESQIPLP